MMAPTQTTSRKRPAPGTSPRAQPSPTSPTKYPDPTTMSNDDFLAYGANADHDTQAHVSPLPPNPYGSSENQQLPDRTLSPAQASKQLVRRNNEQSMAAPNHTSDDQQEWANTGLQAENAWRSEVDEADLQRRAARAKQEGLSRKPPKQIPPFIQKLSSFLDNNLNTDLIRWSQAGDSFVVLDEEQFANRLIPELFKHNNYASFVRQLNMYGFHKRVGLSDNSMRASERKSKSPSEYENEFFKRGRPDLLWLIAKPKQPSTKGKNKKFKEEDDALSEDSERREGEEPRNSTAAIGGPQNKLDLVSLPRSQLVSFQSEIEQLRKSQQHINTMIARFQHENSQYIRQASAQHERHEHSINAILQFLATFYNRSQDSGGTPNMFQMPMPDIQSQGNVQEMGDYDEHYDEQMATGPNNQLARLMKRPLALLAPPGDGVEGNRSVAPEGASRPISQQKGQEIPQHDPPSVEPGPKPSQARSPSNENNVQGSNVTRSADQDQAGLPQQYDVSSSYANHPDSVNSQRRTSTTPRPPATSLPQPSNNDMLAIINSTNTANARNKSQSPDFDFSSALRNFENKGSGPLTSEQRDNMLNMMAGNSGTSTPHISSTANNNPANPQYSIPNDNYLNANVNPHNSALLFTLPTPATELTTNPSADLSLQNYNTAQSQHLSHLHRLQREQDNKVADLTTRLQPLSPSGSIPGLASPSPVPSLNFGDFGNDSGANSGFDFDNWLNSDPGERLDTSGGDLFGADVNDGTNDGDNTHGFSFDDNEMAPHAAGGLVDPDAGFGDAGGYFGDVDLPPPSTAPQDDQAIDCLFDENGDDDRDRDGDDGGQQYQVGRSIHPSATDANVQPKQTEGRRVIGSVSNSEGARTPVARVEDEVEEESGLRRSKRRRTDL